jgi:hypothetical protein
MADRLGKYYLYFADHKGRYIRLADADDIAGPWTIHPPGSLHLEQSGFLTQPPDVTPAQLAEFEPGRSGVAPRCLTTCCRRLRRRTLRHPMCMSMRAADRHVFPRTQ